MVKLKMPKDKTNLQEYGKLLRRFLRKPMPAFGP
jgi:hypothetical protein